MKIARYGMYLHKTMCYHFLAKGGIANEKKTQRHYPVLSNVFITYCAEFEGVCGRDTL